MRLFLDAGPLGQLCHPNARYRPFQQWVLRIAKSLRHQVFLSDVTVYEVRRELVRLEHHASVASLDRFVGMLLPITPDSEAWRSAGEMWARHRNEKGAADPRLDFDVVLAAEAIRYDATVVTSNVKDFETLVRTLTPEEAQLRVF